MVVPLSSTSLSPTPATSLPDWLETWLQIPFYEEKCNKHERQFKTIVCGECMEDPVCGFCWKEKAHLHQGNLHPVLQVCKASHRASIKKQDIRNYMDVSDIYKYKINGHKIVFLKPENPGAAPSSPSCQCHTCGKKLDKISKKFCSISCMVGSIKRRHVKEDDVLEGNTIKIEKLKFKIKIKKATVMKCSGYGCSFRKKSRKGIPQRAPFK